MFGGVIALWAQIKVYLLKIYGLFVVRMIIQDQAAYAFKRLLWLEFNCSPLGAKIFYRCNEYVRPVQRNQVVAFEKIPKEPTIWWRNRKPLIVSIDEDGVSVTFIRFMFDNKKLIIESINKFNKVANNCDWRNDDRFFIRRKIGSIGEKNNNLPNDLTVVSDGDKYINNPLGWDKDELGQPKTDNPMECLSLNKDQEGIISSALHWRNNEKWFKERSIPWKLGWVFTGVPGTGKTVFTKSLAQLLNMPIFSFDLPTMTNSDLNSAWDAMMNCAPCFCLFEDIDGVFHGRKNVSVTSGLQQGLSFDCFLQKLDGIENSDGVLTVITTNDSSKVGPAIGSVVDGGDMLSKPGRIDAMIQFEKLNHEDRVKMANRICSGLDPSKWSHLLKDGEGDTGAQFQCRCSELAGRLFWKTKEQ